MATISFAKISQLDLWYKRSHPGEKTDLNLVEEHTGPGEPEDCVKETRDLLAAVLKLCDTLGNCHERQEKIRKMAKLYEGPRYEAVTLKELQAIKTAMIGRRGIVSHSGHWYNCVNGHPFAIGECGMPMEQARCPECGASIGGQSHRHAEGVSRAQQME